MNKIKKNGEKIRKAKQNLKLEEAQKNTVKYENVKIKIKKNIHTQSRNIEVIRTHTQNNTKQISISNTLKWDCRGLRV